MTDKKPIHYLRLAFPVVVSGVFIMLGAYLIQKENGMGRYIGYANIIFFGSLLVFIFYKIIRSFTNK